MNKSYTKPEVEIKVFEIRENILAQDLTSLPLWDDEWDDEGEGEGE
jgi:hypothetical protein